MPTPEAFARQHIDDLLAACGWIVQDRAALNLYAGRELARASRLRQAILKLAFEGRLVGQSL